MATAFEAWHAETFPNELDLPQYKAERRMVWNASRKHYLDEAAVAIHEVAAHGVSEKTLLEAIWKLKEGGDAK